MLPLALGVGVGGTLLSSLFAGNAQDKVDAARSGVIAAERARQKALDDEAAGINRGAQDRYIGFQGQQDSRAKTLADFFRTPVTTPTTPHTVAALPPSSGGVVQREIDLKRGIADDYVGHQADTLGELRSFGDLMGTIGRAQARDAGTIGQIGSFKKGSAGVQAVELDSAGRAGNKDQMWSDLFGGLGKVGLTAGLAHAFAPAAAAATTTAGAPLNILPAVARAPTELSSVFATGATPFLRYGV